MNELPRSMTGKMEFLRKLGWLVDLKGLPDSRAGWIAQGSRSEYDSPSADRIISKHRWACETTWMGADVWKRGVWATAESPEEAVNKAYVQAMHGE